MSKTDLGKVIAIYDLKNKPDWIKSCQMTEYSNGCVLLNWSSHDNTGEDGFFLSMRACKTYVTQNLTGTKSLWLNNTEDLELYNN